MKKYSLGQLKGKLSNGKDIFITYKIEESGSAYVFRIRIWRLDVIAQLKDHYFNEKYVMILEKQNSETGKFTVDERHEFGSVEEILEYLDKNNLVKRNDIIKEDARK